MRLTRLFFASTIVVGALLSCATSGYAAEKYTESGRASDVWSGYWWSASKSDQPGELFERLRKYDSATRKRAEEWQRTHRFAPNMPGWWGYCQGFTASAIMENEPTDSVKYQNQTFTVGDQKALLALSHAGDVVNVFGARYNGEGDDKNDIAPALLIQTLRDFLRENQAPIALDLCSTEEVWNFPVVAYSVDATVDEELCRGVLEITVAAPPIDNNDQIDYDYVGLIEKIVKYNFEIAVDQGRLLLNDSKWVGDSVDNHPDFAWRPFVVRPESPEIDYNIVQQILNSSAELEPAPPVEVVEEEDEDEPFVQIREDQTQEVTTQQGLAQQEQQNVRPVFDEITPAAPTLALDDDEISLPAAFDFLRCGDSAWSFDITVDQFDGGYYGTGETYTVRGKSAKAGYVYLVGYYMDLQAGRTVFMADTNDGKGYAVKANEVFEITSKEPLPEQLGEYRVRAVVTEKPLVFTKTAKENRAQQAQAPIQQSDVKRLVTPQMQQVCHSARRTPTQPQQTAQRFHMQTQAQVARQAQQRIVVPKVLFPLLRATGDFAQDQVAFIVVDNEEIDEFRNVEAGDAETQDVAGEKSKFNR